MGPSGETEMPRACELLGLPVVAAGTGRRLGRVQDLVLDAAGTRVTGLLLDGGGWMRAPRLVPWTEVAGLADAVVTRAAPAPTPTAGPTWRGLNGMPVLTEAGAELGGLADLWFRPDGVLTGYQLSCGLIDDLLSGQPVLRGPAPLRLGEEAVFLVPSGGGGGGAVPELQ